MAHFNKGILGGFSGKVGTVVGVNWRGKNIMRSLPTKKKKTATPAQAKQRAKFTLAAQFMGPLKAITDKYFGEYQGSKSRTNLAMSHQILRTIVDKEDGTFEIDFSQVVISKGVLPNIAVESIAVDENKLNLTWKSNANANLASENDKLIVVIFSKSQNAFSINLDTDATRSSEAVTITLPQGFAADDNEVWVLLASDDNAINSTSAYLGEA